MILLVGNMLSVHGLNPTSIEDLSQKLSANFSIKSISNKKNKFIRAIDMLFSITVNNRRCELIIVDVFGTSAFYFSILVIMC